MDKISSNNSKAKDLTTTVVEALHEEDWKDPNADKAIKYKEQIEGLIIDPVLEKKMVRKIDFCLLPLIGLLMSCQNMDKSTNSYASIMGLREDLKMKDQAYSWVGSSFYFGYLVFQLPVNMLLQKFPVAKTLGTFLLLWGIVLCCHAACYSSASFLACRVILGSLECAMNPAYMLITSMWYKREDSNNFEGKNDTKSKRRANQQFLRTAIWFGSQGFGNFLGSTISYGLYVHSYKIASWRLLYVVIGLKTLFLGIVSLIHLPDIPVKAWFLNETEKKYVVERSRINQQGFGNSKFKKDQFIEAMTDIRSYLLFFYGVSYCIANGGYTNFGSILLHEDFGFSTTSALLMNMCGGTIDMLCPLVVMGVALLVQSRLLICSIINLFILVGMCCLAFTEPKGSRLFGYLTFYLSTAVVAGAISYISSNIAGHTKKICVHAIFSIGYCVGNIIGPQTYRQLQAPNYIGAKIALVVAFSASTAFLLLIYVIDQLENRRRDRERLEDVKIEVIKDFEFADLTDKQNREFRYCP